MARFPRRETAQKSRVQTALIAGTEIEGVRTVQIAFNAAHKSRVYGLHLMLHNFRGVRIPYSTDFGTVF